MSRYGIFSGPYFPIFELNTEISPNTGKYGPEKNPYLDTFHEVLTMADACNHVIYQKIYLVV